MYQWKFNEDREAIYRMEEVMMDMTSNLHAIMVNPEMTRAKIHAVSVNLRKLLFDNRSIPLIKTCIEKPRMHPLRNSATLTGATEVRTYKSNPDIVMDICDPERKQFVCRAYESPGNYHVIIRPMHGMELNKESGKFECRIPFDENATPITIGKWLNQRLLRIEIEFYSDGKQSFSIETVLRELTNTLGAHASERYGKALSLSQQVKFGELTYMHIFALTTAMYLEKMVDKAERTAINMPRWTNFVKEKKPIEMMAIDRKSMKYPRTVGLQTRPDTPEKNFVAIEMEAHPEDARKTSAVPDEVLR